MSDIEIFSYDPFTVEIDREGGMYPKYTVTISYRLHSRNMVMDFKSFEIREEAYDWALGSIEELADSLGRLRKKVEGVA